MSEQNSSQKIRERVARDYARAVQRKPGETSAACADGAATGRCCASPQKGAAAHAAGYTAQELATLPEDAAINSFGCGNPVAHGQLEPGQVVLDLGAGAGIDVLLAARRVGPAGKVIGIDMTGEMVAAARANIARSGLGNAEVRQGIIEELPVESGSVDWVISNCVINLSPEKSRVFSEIQRVLKPGGRFLISDIVVEDLPVELRDDPALHSSCVAGAISESEYLDGLRRAGLVDVSVTERLVYEESQLRAFLESEEISLPSSESETGSADLQSPGGDPLTVTDVVGKVWSARFTGQKPAA